MLLQEVMRRSYIKVKSSLRMNVIRHLQHVSHWQSELTRPVCPVGSVKYQRSVPKQEKVPDRLVWSSSAFTFLLTVSTICF